MLIVGGKKICLSSHIVILQLQQVITNQTEDLLPCVQTDYGVYLGTVQIFKDFNAIINDSNLKALTNELKRFLGTYM